jgi:predicted transcriptional regulator
MCQILLSINPEHVENILNGTKRYEFRKVRCKSDVDKIVIYSTAPQKMVVAEVEVEDVIVDDVFEVWEQTKTHAGINQDFYLSYYEGKTKAVAYKLGNVEIYEEPKSLSDFGLAYPPQSFAYLETTQIQENMG